MRIFAITACLALGGCVPWADSYLYMDVSNAVYYQSACRASVGAPSLAVYPFHRISISVDITFHPRLGLHVPEGYTVQLNDDTIRIEGWAANGPVAVPYRIKAFRRISIGDANPRAFTVLPDPYTTPDNFGPLLGASKGQQSLYYLFLAVDQQNSNHLAVSPRGLSRGTVVIPAMTINGQHYEEQRLPFLRKTHVEIMPVNC